MGKILGIGEVLWDLFPTGKFLGGAPANFVFHCRQMGLDAHPVSRVGHDDLGREMLADLTAKDIPTGLVQTDRQRPTGTVRVDMQGAGHRFTITENVAWDFLAPDPDALTEAKRARAVCFGSLAQRSDVSREAIRALVRACPGLIVFDINLRQHFYTRQIIEDSLDLSTVLKLNNDEVKVLKDLLDLSGRTDAEIAREILEEFSLDLVCVTRGPNGAMLVNEDDVADQPGKSVKVADTVGCGDAFTAVLVSGLLEEKDLATIVRTACRVGEFVATQSGATPPWPKELLDSDL
jgi:fructokinase